jgi:hypothetical protein
VRRIQPHVFFVPFVRVIDDDDVVEHLRWHVRR